MDDFVNCARCGNNMHLDNSFFNEGERLCMSCLSIKLQEFHDKVKIINEIMEEFDAKEKKNC